MTVLQPPGWPRPRGYANGVAVDGRNDTVFGNLDDPCNPNYNGQNEGTGIQGTGTPLDPDGFVADLADALTRVVADPARAAEMGEAGRLRAQQQFAWDTIGRRTIEVYESVL